MALPVQEMYFNLKHVTLTNVGAAVAVSVFSDGGLNSTVLPLIRLTTSLTSRRTASITA
jgi:hypothetical protein